MNLKLYPALACLASAALLSACGGGARVPWRTGEEDGMPAVQRQIERMAHERLPEGSGIGFGAPVETYLVGGEVPERVGLSAFSVEFRSNVPSARYECKPEGSSQYQPCARWTFEKLADGQSYGLVVRACATNGRCDESPLVIAFVASRQSPDRDRRNETPAGDGEGEETPAADPSLPSADAAGERTLQIGSAVTLTVPPAYSVTSFSTTKTTSTQLYTVRRLGVHAGSAYAGEACNHGFDREQVGEDGVPYCVGAPSRSELPYAKPLPWNHAEMVRGSGATTEEKIFVAAFDAEGDPMKGRLGIEWACARAALSGNISVPVLAPFFVGDGPVRREVMKWCEVQDTSGVHWWMGAFTVVLNPEDPASQSITVVHSAAASLGITSAPAFAARTRDLFQVLLKQLAP